MISSHLSFVALFFIIYGIGTYSAGYGSDDEVCEKMGCKGERGPEGPKGDQGEKGYPGVNGERGDPGESKRGERGDPGEQGHPGRKGEEGDKGKDGRRGTKGEPGKPAPASPPPQITIFYEKERAIPKPGGGDNATSNDADGGSDAGDDVDVDVGQLNYTSNFSLAFHRTSNRLVILIENFDGNGTAKEVEIKTNRATLARVLMSSGFVVMVMLFIAAVVKC